jgi:hypothetical protein
MTEFSFLAQHALLVQAGQTTRVADAAARLYSQTRLASWWAARWGRLIGHRPPARDLMALASRVQGQHSLGLQTVPLAQIRGSEGRTTDFDAAFRPLADHSRGRWVSIARARLADEPLPAVELILVDDMYYVRDGNHRISVARALGQQQIDAQVTVWDVALAPEAGCPAPSAKSSVPSAASAVKWAGRYRLRNRSESIRVL